MTGVKPFFIGFRCFFRGFSTLAGNSSLWKWALIPLVTSFVIFVSLVIFIGDFALERIVLGGVTLLPENEALKTIASYIISALAVVAIVLFSAFLTFIVLRLVAGPFNGILAERVLVLRGTIQSAPQSLSEWLKLSFKMLVVGLRNGILILIVAIALFFISFIPGLNLIIAFAFALIATFEATDYSLEALRMSAKPRIDYFYSNIRYFSGFALALGLVFLIPGLNLLLFPVAVVGASELVAQIHFQKRQ